MNLLHLLIQIFDEVSYDLMYSHMRPYLVVGTQPFDRIISSHATTKMNSYAMGKSHEIC